MMKKVLLMVTSLAMLPAFADETKVNKDVKEKVVSPALQGFRFRKPKRKPRRKKVDPALIIPELGSVIYNPTGKPEGVAIKTSYTTKEFTLKENCPINLVSQLVKFAAEKDEEAILAMGDGEFKDYYTMDDKKYMKMDFLTSYPTMDKEKGIMFRVYKIDKKHLNKYDYDFEVVTGYVKKDSKNPIYNYWTNYYIKKKADGEWILTAVNKWKGTIFYKPPTKDKK